MDKKELIRDFMICLSLFLIMLSIRLGSMDNYQYMIGNPDAAWAAMQTEHLIKNGFQYPYNDSRTLYPKGRVYYPSQIGWWLVGATTYDLVSRFYSLDHFDQNLLTKIMMLMIAVVSSLSAPFLYLFMKELFNMEAGLFTALFMCFFIPTFSYTMYGVPENDGFGLALFFGGLWTFIRYLKHGGYLNLLLFLIINLWSSLTWQAYGVLCVIIALSSLSYVILSIILSFLEKEYKVKIEKIKRYSWLLSVILFINLFGVLIHSGFQVGTTISIVALLINIAYLIYLNNLKLSFDIVIKNKYIPLGMISIILIAFFGGISPLLGTLDFVGIHLIKQKVNKDVIEKTKIVYETIAEQQPIKSDASSMLGKPIEQVNFLDVLSVLDKKYGFNVNSIFSISVIHLFLLSIVILFLAGVINLLLFKQINEIYFSLFAVFSYAILSLIKKPVSMFFLAGLCVLGVGILVGFIIQLLRNYHKHLSLLVSFVIIFALVVSNVSIAYLTSKSYGPGQEAKEWYPTLMWLKNNTENGSILTSWWDYGHFYSYYLYDHNRYTIDNIQYGPFIYDVARAFTNTPCTVADQREFDIELRNSSPYGIISSKMAEALKNTRCDLLNNRSEKLFNSEVRSLKILEKYKTDYIIIDKSVILGKSNALQHIAGNANGFYTTRQIIGQTGKGVYFELQKGYRILIPWDKYFKAMFWPGAIIDIPGTDVKLRILIKKDTVYIPVRYVPGRYLDNGKWQVGITYDPDAPVVYSFMSRIYFRDPSLKYLNFTGYDSGWNVVYKVNWKKYLEDKINGKI